MDDFYVHRLSKYRTESINFVVFLVSKYSINLDNKLIIYALCPAAPRINLPAKLKEPVEVESGEDLVMKVPYSGHPTPKVPFSKYYFSVMKFMFH